MDTIKLFELYYVKQWARVFYNYGTGGGGVT